MTGLVPWLAARLSPSLAAGWLPWLAGRRPPWLAGRWLPWLAGRRPGAGGAGAAGHGGGFPVIGRQGAQRMAREELSRPLYHQQPPLAERILHAVQDWLGGLFRSASRFPGGWWGLVALAVVAVVLATVIFSWTGPPARARRRQGVLPPQRPLTARDYRESAARLAASGDYTAAICEGVRAIAAELDERAVLPPRAGRTADEFAHEAGLALPGHASGLYAAARLFDDVRYGDRAGTRHGYEQVRDLDLSVRATASRAARPAAATPAVSGRP